MQATPGRGRIPLIRGNLPNKVNDLPYKVHSVPCLSCRGYINSSGSRRA
jgi:hypothetical protein